MVPTVKFYKVADFPSHFLESREPGKVVFAHLFYYIVYINDLLKNYHVVHMISISLAQCTHIE